MGKKHRKNKIRETKLRKQIATGVALFGVVCLVTVWQRVTVEVTIRDIGVLEKRLKEISDRNSELEVTLAQLRDFRRLHNLAIEKRKMRFPERISLMVPKDYQNLLQDEEKAFNTLIRY